MTARVTDYTSKSQQRLLQLIKALAGNEFMGLAPGELAKAIQASASQITRDLHNLKLAGYAEEVPATGRWRLGPSLVQVGLQYLQCRDRAQSRLDELNQRYTRTI